MLTFALRRFACQSCLSFPTQKIGFAANRTFTTSQATLKWTAGHSAHRFEERNRNPNAREDEPKTENEDKFGSLSKKPLKPQAAPNHANIAPSMRNKFRLFQDEQEEVLDSAMSAEWVTIEAPEEEQLDEFEGLSLERGKTGVYDIEELVKVLQMENADGICVVSIPSEMQFADYMVVACGQSSRQLLGMAQFIARYYKKKKTPKDAFLDNNTVSKWKPNWICLDLGNIILHLMEWETRRTYDIEALWALGPEHDPECQAPIDGSIELVERHSRIVTQAHPAGMSGTTSPPAVHLPSSDSSSTSSLPARP